MQCRLSNGGYAAVAAAMVRVRHGRVLTRMFSAMLMGCLDLVCGVMRGGQRCAARYCRKALQRQQQCQQQCEDRPVARVRSHDNGKHIITARTLHAMATNAVN